MSAGQLNAAGFVNGTGGAAQFNGPHGIAWDGAANLYVTDANNNAVRKIVIATGEVTTVAGGNNGSWDETGALAAFSGLAGIAVASTGDIYVAETNNLKIRRVTPAGVVTSVAGTLRSNGYTDFSTAGTGPDARFAFPYGITPGPAGGLYILDQGNDTVDLATPALLADVATVNPADGGAGTLRQLDTAPQTATAWNWQLIRKPAGSSATLSSASLRNPTFTPDAADMFQFRLSASGPAGRRISTVSLFGCNRAVIVSSPADVQACAGSQLYFAVSASGGNLSYQWKRDGVIYGGFGGGVNPALNIASAPVSASGNYSCAITNACGTLETNPAHVTFGNAPPATVGNSLRLDRSLSAITWGDITNRQSYSVYEDTSAGGAFPTLTGTASSGATGVGISFDASTEFYKVIAVNACGAGP